MSMSVNVCVCVCVCVCVSATSKAKMILLSHQTSQYHTRTCGGLHTRYTHKAPPTTTVIRGYTREYPIIVTGTHYYEMM